ncbi:MAG: hypothetical protein CH6_0237 [Candidatus Kapaibacterium sp.]|nr:MAG: hypothetical protein CH6_0237 [Candidatus Kapabacteria bacterium]
MKQKDTYKKEDVKENLIRLIEGGRTIQDACRLADISRSTFYRWCKEDPGFKERVEIADRSNVFLVEHYLMELIRQHNPTAIIFYLKTKGAWRGWRNEKSEKED